MNNQIGIVGGGASGMMAAVIAARSGAKVTLFDHAQRIGKKILSTGNGKCNFTNLNLSKDDYNGNHPSFVASAFQKFDAMSAISFFEDAGMVATSVRGGYCYPFSSQASTVLNTLRMLLDSLHVTIYTECEIKSITKKDKSGSFLIQTNKQSYLFDKVILACGGKSAPSTGSDGSGYAYAKAFGHKLIRPLPALTYLTSKEKELISLAGVRTQTRISLFANDTCVQQEEGELQLNKANLSGIPVFQLSHKAIREFEQKKIVSIHVDFLKDFTQEETGQLLEHIKKKFPTQSIEDALGGLMNKKIVVAILHKAQIQPSIKMKEVSAKQLNQISKWIHDFRFEVNGYGDDTSAQVTMGGVDTMQMTENMMSKLVDGLYIIGEMLDIDGRCGGYNLQWAWTSGYIAGQHSATGEVKCYESHNVKLV